MSNRIITIEREYASGGREVGELVAKQLGIPFYNREILEMASERCGVSVDYLASAEEAAPKSFLYTLMLSSNPTRSIQENLPLSDKVYIIETNIIKELAEKSDCVIVGRCASYILRDMEHMMSAFVYADQESRVGQFQNTRLTQDVQKQLCGSLTGGEKLSTALTPAETGMTRKTTHSA